MEKSVILIDAENILKSWWAYCSERDLKYKVDYKKLINVLSKDTNLLRAYYYDGAPECIHAPKRIFYEALHKNGIQLRTKVLRNKTLKCQYCGKETVKQIQKGVDVSLATDILRHAFQKTSDICIIVSGDEDYKDAIEVARDRGIKVWICSFRKSLSRELASAADKIIYIEHIIENVRR